MIIKGITEKEIHFELPHFNFFLEIDLEKRYKNYRKFALYLQFNSSDASLETIYLLHDRIALEEYPFSSEEQQVIQEWIATQNIPLLLQEEKELQKECDRLRIELSKEYESLSRKRGRLHTKIHQKMAQGLRDKAFALMEQKDQISEQIDLNLKKLQQLKY